MRPVVFVAPFPLETTMRFARAAAALPGVRLLGVVRELPRGRDRALYADVERVADPLDAGQLEAAVRRLAARHGRPHRLVGVLEPLQVQLAEVRERLGIPGTDVRTATLFRDKARMKEALRAAGLPCARHRLLTSVAEGEAFAAEVGLPLVLKPPAGMGCKATWRVDNREQLRSALEAARPSPDHPVLAEEFLRGTEHSLETITVRGRPRFWSVTRYAPTPLEVMEHPWIQWCIQAPRDLSGPQWTAARDLGIAAVRALGLGDGFTHMEWFRRPDGTLAIGEIAARPPGANIVRVTGLAYDADLYRAWARAVIDGAYDPVGERRHSVGCAFLRGPGRGRVAAIRGLEQAQQRVRGLVEEVRLPRLGTPKSDSYEGDGYVIVRHRDDDVVERALRAIIETVRIEYA
ncbi:MAG: ATP-grasp domain-containing protein [Myxococcota bacterium]|nr:ATP-grasp domain-containing protein [Myxococcota bacterium]MDW8361846.1 ATP-grasp domain-containing protein [Myxococcales bacterium]